MRRIVADLLVIMLQGAASFFAMREYEKHQAANGQPPNHQFAKEVDNKLTVM